MKTQNIVLSKHFNKNFIYLDHLYNKFNPFLPRITIMCNASQVDKKYYVSFVKIEKKY